jgi:hypothetical protein
VLSSALGAVTTIIKHPVRFLGNLIDSVKEGLGNFVGNIGSHIKKGLMTWLFGAVSAIGITLPKVFDLPGIFHLVMQVLGLTWDAIRAMAVKVLGEKVVGYLEKTFDIFVTIKEKGLAGLWDFIADKIGDIKEMVMSQIEDMLTTQVIKAGIQWLIGILGGPAGAFIKAAKAIFDIVMWFLNNGKRVMSLVQSIIGSITAIASGNLGGAAKMVEESLAKAIPVVISFLASLLGLGNIAEKVKDIIQTIRKPIEKAIGWVLGKAKAAVSKVGGWLTGKGKEREGPKAAPGKDAPYDERWGHAVSGVQGKLTGMGEKAGDPEAVKAQLPGWKAAFNFTDLAVSSKEGELVVEGEIQRTRVASVSTATPKVPARRYLPDEFDVRGRLYELGSGWGTTRDKFKDKELPIIEGKVAEILSDYRSGNNSSAQRKMQNLIKKDQIPAGYTLNDLAKAEKNGLDDTFNYEVDHIIPLSRHWAQWGWKTDDSKRWEMATKTDNLQLITREENRRKSGMGWEYGDQPYVSKEFTSHLVSSDGLTIEGKHFRDKDGKSIKANQP